MKKHVLAIAASVMMAAGAHANSTLVAGWDFSQYIGPGVLSTDGASVASTLSANYSDLDSTQATGLGVGSELFGTLYVDGTNGSTAANPADGSPYNPANLNLTLNDDAAVAAGVLMGSAGAGNLLTLGETGGQMAFGGTLAFQATGMGSAVFGADLSSVASVGNQWELSFAGLGSTGASNLGISTSIDGVNYSPFQTVGLTGTETLYTFGITGTDLSQLFLQFNFDGLGGAAIDNVALKANVSGAVPEPGTTLMLLVGMLGLRRFNGHLV